MLGDLIESFHIVYLVEGSTSFPVHVYSYNLPIWNNTNMKKPSKKWAFNMPNNVQLSHGVELSSSVYRLRACSGDVEGEGQKKMWRIYDSFEEAAHF